MSALRYLVATVVLSGSVLPGDVASAAAADTETKLFAECAGYVLYLAEGDGTPSDAVLPGDLREIVPVIEACAAESETGVQATAQVAEMRDAVRAALRAEDAAAWSPGLPLRSRLDAFDRWLELDETMRLTCLTAEMVDRYRACGLRQGRRLPEPLAVAGP